MISGTYGRMNSSTGLGLDQRLPRVVERRGGDALEAGQLAGRVDQVVIGPAAGDGQAQVVDRGLRARDQRAQVAQERCQLLRRRLRRGDERVEVVERRAQVDERRVRAPQGERQQRERLIERDVLARDRRRRRVRVADEGGEVVAPLGHRGDRARGVDDEVGQRGLVLRELVDELSRRRQERVEVLGRLARLLALAVVLRGEALDDALQVLARVRVERVEERVEVDDGGRRAGRERRAVVELLGRVGRRRQGDVAVRDARQRREADDGRRAVAQRRVGLLDLHAHARAVVVGQRDLADGADAAAADLHVVVLDQLAGVLEQQVVRVRLAAAEQQDGNEHDRQDERGSGHATGDRHRTLCSLKLNPGAAARHPPCGRRETIPDSFTSRYRAGVIPCPAGRARRPRGTAGRTCCPS